MDGPNQQSVEDGASVQKSISDLDCSELAMMSYVQNKSGHDEKPEYRQFGSRVMTVCC